MVVQFISRIVDDVHAIRPLQDAPLIQSLLLSPQRHYLACLLPRPQFSEAYVLLALL